VGVANQLLAQDKPLALAVVRKDLPLKLLLELVLGHVRKGVQLLVVGGLALLEELILLVDLWQGFLRSKFCQSELKS